MRSNTLTKRQTFISKFQNDEKPIPTNFLWTCTAAIFVIESAIIELATELGVFLKS